MPAIPAKADIAESEWDVRVVPEANSASLFDYLAGACHYRFCPKVAVSLDFRFFL